MRDALQQLISKGHKRHSVEEFIRTYLVPIMHEVWGAALESNIKFQRGDEPWEQVDTFYFVDQGTYLHTWRELEKWVDTCNRFLHDVMSGVITVGTDSYASAIASLLWELRGYIGFAPRILLGTTPEPRRSPRWGKDDAIDISDLPNGVYPLTSGETAWLIDGEPSVRNLVAAIVLKRDQSAAIQRFVQARVTYWKRHSKTYPADERSQTARKEPFDEYAAARSRAMFELHRLRLWIDVITQLGQELAEEPIRIATGQFIPRYQERTYAYMEDQIGNDLAKLKPRQARIRILTEDSQGRRTHTEHTIETLDLRPAVVQEQLTERIASLMQRHQTVDQIYKPREVIDEEIRRRQHGDDPPRPHMTTSSSSEPPGSGQSRRSGIDEDDY